MKLSIISLAVACLLTTHAFAKDDISTRVAKAGHEIAATAPSVAQSGATAVGSVSDAVESVSGDAKSVINNVVDKASVGLASITNKLESAAPEAWKLVVAGTKAKAEATLLVGLFAGVSALLSWLAFSSHLSKANFDVCSRYNVTVFMFFGLAMVSSITASLYLLSSDAWAAYLSPEGILALGILNMALSHT